MAAVEEVHILWISALLSCDGDAVSITAAVQPSIEDVLMSNIPELPKFPQDSSNVRLDSGRVSPGPQYAGARGDGEGRPLFAPL
jgi:hydrogenase small subunit